MAGPGITLIKEMEYDGETEEWSNQYNMTLAPSDPAGWRTAVDGLVEQERTVYSSRVTILRALCYDQTTENTVYVYDLALFDGTVAGNLSVGSSLGLPGDTAGWVRWDTGARSVSGKPIYLRKYFHDVRSDGSPSLDNIYGAQVTAYQAFGEALLDALGGGFALADAAGNQPPGPVAVSTYATTRTLHRRGRRPILPPP